MSKENPDGIKTLGTIAMDNNTVSLNEHCTSVVYFAND